MDIFSDGDSADANQNGGYFGSNMHRLSHELRTPLNHINGFAELLLMDESLSPANAEYVRAILNGGETLKAAVISYLDHAEAIAPGSAALPDTEGGPARAGVVDFWSCSPFRSNAKLPKPRAAGPLSPSEELRPESVVGPLGQPMTLASLPPVDTKRWISHRKAELVAAVHGGLLTIEEVCERYGIELEEFVTWQRGVERLGMRGLWVTRTQKHRDLFKRRPYVASAPDKPKRAAR